MDASEDFLFVVFELHDEGFDVLALGLPLGDALFCVAVEVLVLLVQQGVVPQSGVLLHDEILLCFSVLVSDLFFEVV
jgi:hypothetical protein